jgi:hypothetical protein
MDLDPDTVVIKIFLGQIADRKLESEKSLFLLKYVFSVLQVPEHICKQ